MAAFDTHIPGVMTHLKRRLHYEVCNKPAIPESSPSDKRWKLSIVQKLLSATGRFIVDNLMSSLIIKLRAEMLFQLKIQRGF